MIFLIWLSLLLPLISSNPIDVIIDGWSDRADLVIDNRWPSFSWKLSDACNMQRCTRSLRAITQKSYQLKVNQLQPLAIAMRAVSIQDSINTDICQYGCLLVWDSQMVQTSNTLNVRYAGAKPLDSNSWYQWCIRCQNNNQQISGWSCGTFRTALMYPESELAGVAEWIGSMDSLQVLNEMRREFDLSQFSWSIMTLLSSAHALTDIAVHPITAALFVCGIGYHHVFVNGERVDPSRQLDPAWTTYESRLYYSSFDVLSFLQPGLNAIGVRLGGGWFNKGMHYAWQLPKPDYGSPRFILRLVIQWSNGSETNLISDKSWTGRQNGILMDHVYHGEVVDGRLDRPGWSNVGFVDNRSLWRPVDEVQSPGGRLQLQPLDPIRSGPSNLHNKLSQSAGTDVDGLIGAPIILPNGFINASNVTQPIRSVFIFDLGQNFAGWIRIFVKGPPGWPIIIHYGEALLSLPASMSTHVFQASFRGATQTDTYLLRGDPDGEWYEPSFTYHGFRYISIYRPFSESITVDQVIGVPVHSETSLIGSFQSSSRVINQIQHNIQWGMMSQAIGIFTDCPSRDERMGWMDDLLLTSDQGLYNFDLIQFYKAFLDQMDDGQLESGNYYDTTPVMLDEDSDPNWSSAPLILAWTVYKHTWDLSVIIKHYSNYEKFINYWYSLYNSTGLIDMPGQYGDWSPPTPYSPIPPALPSSYIFMLDILVFINMSKLINNSGNIRKFEQLYYAQLAPEFHEAFFNADQSCYYPDCPQAAQVLALDLPNVVPGSLRSTVVNGLVKSITNIGSFTGGETSYARLWFVLSDNGQHDVAIKLAESTSYPSLGYQFDNIFGIYATTLWEIFDAYESGLPGMNSLNHVMFSTVGQWYYERLAGIEITTNVSQPVVIHPRLPLDHSLLYYVQSEHVSVYGPIFVNWSIQSPILDHSQTRWLFNLTVYLPPNLPMVPIVFEPLAVGSQCLRLTESYHSVSVLWNNWTGECRSPKIDGVVTVCHDASSSFVYVHVSSGRYSFQSEWSAPSSFIL